jgi:flagellin-like protein
MKSRKAVSPVIAVILLIAIAVAASVTVFAYTQGILGGVTQANLVISNFNTVDSDTVTVTVQNVGGTSTTVDQIDQEDDGSNIDGTQVVRNAITGELIDADGDSGFNTDLVISAGNSITLEISRSSGSWTSGEVCTVELWVDGNTGSTASFEADFVVA